MSISRSLGWSPDGKHLSFMSAGCRRRLGLANQHRRHRRRGRPDRHCVASSSTRTRAASTARTGHRTAARSRSCSRRTSSARLGSSTQTEQASVSLGRRRRRRTSLATPGRPMARRCTSPSSPITSPREKHCGRCGPSTSPPARRPKSRPRSDPGSASRPDHDREFNGIAPVFRLNRARAAGAPR